MLDIDSSQLDGPDFLNAVANAEEANGNAINAAEFRRRSRQWANERVQRDNASELVIPAARAHGRGCTLPAHHITPTDRR